MKIFLDTNVILELKFRTPESHAFGCNVREYDFCNNKVDADYQEEYTAAVCEGFKTGFLSNEVLDEDRISLNIPKTFHGKIL